MAPTTLVTFLVRTPPSTRSVRLYGSWDNFSTPYPMQRDARIGPEHWSGCHSFSNIICDGDVSGNTTPRHGGLKMGGTYWYYYTLDDEIEFHNSAEPSTTTCPMLPGQLVNVLNVPFALSRSGRSRNDSTSSTSSEFRTMNPTDKFLNPRPVPVKPSLPRLKTSPTMQQQPWSSCSSPISATSVSSLRGRSLSTRAPSPPGSGNVLALVRPKPTAEIPSRSTSRGSNRSVGIIGGLRALASPLMMSPGPFSERGRTPTEGPRSPATRSRGSSSRSITPRQPVPGTATVTLDGDDLSLQRSVRDLAFRRDFTNAAEASASVSLSSFAQHRRQRSLSREPSSLRNSQQSETSPDATTFGQTTVVYHPLETVKEVTSAANTPVWPLTALKLGGEDEQRRLLDLEKRLPTLPNTPSSAYPSSIADDEVEEPETFATANLQSHFSCTTIDSAPNTDSYIFDETSRFSDWTDAPARASPQSTYPLSLLDFEPASPPAEVVMDSPSDFASSTHPGADHQQGQGTTAQPITLPSASSFSTFSSVASSAAPSSRADPDSATSAHFSWSKFQHYSLPAEDIASGITLKPAVSVKIVTPLVVEAEHQSPQRAVHLDTTIDHSTSMQLLLDELSYLGGMIQQH